MSTAITVSGNPNLTIMSDNISSISKTYKSEHYGIRIVMFDDNKYVNFATIQDRDNAFNSILAAIGTPVAI